MEEQPTQALSPTSVRPPSVREVVMEEHIVQTLRHTSGRSTSLRDSMAVIFRHRVLLVCAFLTTFLGVVLITWLMPKLYETRVKILVNRERPYPATTLDGSLQATMVRDVTLEDLNSEVELIKSYDLLQKVVVSTGLDKLQKDSLLDRLMSPFASKSNESAAQDLRIPRAIRTLDKALAAELIAKSKMIELRYTSEDPRLAAKVLETLSSLYLEKHLAVHRPPGALDFFEQQTGQYQKGLQQAERRLAEFSSQKGVVSIEIEKDITLRKLADFETQLRESKTAETAIEQRVQILAKQAASTPARVVTQMRTSDNPLLLQQIKTTLLTLEMKRTELLSKYEPGYRDVQEVDAQIAQAREALSQAEKNTMRDEVTDLDKTRQWLDEELVRARAELATLKARSIEIEKSVETYRERARQIGRKDFEHHDLARAARTAEENYLLYSRKQEEGRISEELDRKRIVNVAIAEAATVPALPSSPRWDLNLILGLTLALLVSLGLVFAVDFMDPSFRTTDEVEGYLGLPVLAALPRMQ